MSKIFKQFFNSNASGGLILLLCVIVSLLIANLPIGEVFNKFLNYQIGFDNIHLKHSISAWINDGLMAIFFLLIGLEIKRETVKGALSTPRQALLPIFCAIGGAIVPATIYYLINKDTQTVNGWGITMATDIPFAIAILSMLSKKIPSSLKIFLAALAIVDDLIAILVIAFFYSGELHSINLLYSGAIIILLIIFNRIGVRNLAFYLIPGLFLWYFIHHSGIHATIAGVIVALTIPVSNSKESISSPLDKLEHFLTIPVTFLIIPLFALANTNIRFEVEMLNGLTSPLSIGIIGGLVLGKPIGVLLASLLAVKTKICAIPLGANWMHIIGVGCLAGIGFTMSIFITLLSFTDNQLVSSAKFSILLASCVSGVFGYLLLRNNKSNIKYKTNDL